MLIWRIKVEGNKSRFLDVPSIDLPEGVVMHKN